MNKKLKTLITDGSDMDHVEQVNITREALLGRKLTKYLIYLSDETANLAML